MAKKYQLIGGTLPDGADLPKVSTDDNGKVLRVVDGEWQTDDLPVCDGTCEEVSDEDIENLFRQS